jgi:hypothetical protein
MPHRATVDSATVVRCSFKACKLNASSGIRQQPWLHATTVPEDSRDADAALHVATDDFELQRVVLA